MRFLLSVNVRISGGRSWLGHVVADSYEAACDKVGIERMGGSFMFALSQSNLSALFGVTPWNPGGPIAEDTEAPEITSRSQLEAIVRPLIEAKEAKWQGKK